MMNPNDDKERTTPFPGPHGQSKPQPYQFTPEELRILKECNRESFYQRSLPFSAILGGATYYAVKIGKFSPHAALGPLPKVTAAILLGFFLGKFSYQRKCAEKFIAIPDSKLGQILRARRSGKVQESLEPGLGPSMSLGPFGSISDSYTDIPKPNQDFDYGSRPSPEGLDDSFRPSLDNPIIIHEEEMPPEQKNFTSYEELRKKNREEYEQKKVSTYREYRNPPAPSPRSPAPSTSEFGNDVQPPLAGKNKYGDSWG